MNKVWRGLPLIFFVIAVLLAFTAGFFVGEQNGLPQITGITNQEEGKPGDVDFSLFWDAWVLLERKYANSEELNREAMLHGAISGMVQSLEDPYTVFMDPDGTKKFLEDIQGTFEGVGMEIGIRNNVLKVIAPLEGTPAQRAGLRAGDTILTINSTPTRDLTVDEAVSLIRGPKGTTVILTILRDDWKEAREFVIERSVIEVRSLRWEMKEGNVAHLKLFQFSEKANTDFSKAVSEMVAAGADRIVLDLRNNPGGYLEVSQDIAGWFLESGAPVTIEDFGEEKKEYKARGSGRLKSFPVVVLINEGSASASEILAGALRDNLATPLVGKQSFGKGSVQELEHLRGGSSLKITVANWLTPKGEHISGKGLTPDVEVELTEEDYDAGRDPQLDKALELVKKL